MSSSQESDKAYKTSRAPGVKEIDLSAAQIELRMRVAWGDNYLRRQGTLKFTEMRLLLDAFRKDIKAAKNIETHKNYFNAPYETSYNPSMLIRFANSLMEVNILDDVAKFESKIDKARAVNEVLRQGKRAKLEDLIPALKLTRIVTKAYELTAVQVEAALRRSEDDRRLQSL